MNRQQRRRPAREGKQQGPQWDIIIPAALVVLVLAVFVATYLFPNLNLSTYAGASPRILRKIGDRGIARLRNDWPNIKTLSYGYLAENTWPTYQIEKKDEAWAFTDLEKEQTLDYATNNLPEFYVDLPVVLDKLQTALHDKAFTVSYQQTSDGMNVFTVIKIIDKEKQLQEQYALGFDKNHNLDRIIYLSALEEEVTGYAFADLYKVPEPTITTP